MSADFRSGILVSLYQVRLQGGGHLDTIAACYRILVLVCHPKNFSDPTWPPLLTISGGATALYI